MGGRWYEARTSSADGIAPLDWSMPMVSASDGELVSGGSFTARFEVEDWLPSE